MLHHFIIADETTNLTELPDVKIAATSDLAYVLLQCQLAIQQDTEITYHC